MSEIITATQLSVNQIKLAQTAHPIDPLLQQRWSPRAFRQQTIEPEKIASLFEAARWSASGANMQPWSFIIATAEQPAEFQRLLACLSASNATWAQHAALIGVAVAQVIRNDKPSRLAFFDLGLAMQNLVIQATSLGLHVHMMGGFSKELVQERYHLPPTHEAAVAFVVGYLGDPATLDDKDREREVMPRTRKQIEEFVFGEEWGKVTSLIT